MNNSVEIKKALMQITKILEAYDIGAAIILHTPGQAEYLIKVNPSYSCAKFEEGMLRIRAHAKELKGGEAERNKKLADTSNMLHLLQTTSLHIHKVLQTASEKLDEVTQATHFDPPNPPGNIQHN